MADITEKLLDKAETTITALVSRVATVVDTHGAEAAQLAGRIIQLQTLKEMLSCIGMGIFSYILYRIARYWAWPFGKKHEKESECASYLPGIGILVGFCITTLLTVVGFFSNLLNPLNWAILMDYRVAIAAKIIDTLGK